jgi:glutamyl-tRNA synthetase
MVRTRFAPSPTGYLHIGGVRTALFCWLFTRRHGGQFLLRIDDTDAKREVEGALAPILHGFHWLGMEWDEGPEIGGPHAPYFQSQRMPRYQAAAAELLARGMAYRDYATPAELDAERKAAEAAKRPFLYDRRWMADTPEKQKAFEAEGRAGVVRLKMPREGSLVIDDIVRGRVEFDWAREQDHVVQRADGSCLYHLASTVDDYDFGITHVIRSEEHLSNTARQAFIAQSLGYPLPAYAHLPYVAEPGSKEKLSKRKLDKYLKNKAFAQLFDHGQKIMAAMGKTPQRELFNPVVVDFYEHVGYLPEAILNYLLLVGWSLDDKTEFLTVPEMIANFSLERVVKGSASFDPDKLWAFQGHYMGLLSTEKKMERMLPYMIEGKLIAEPVSDADRAKLARVITAAADRLKVFGDVLLYADFFFKADDAFEYDTKDFEKRVKAAGSVERLVKFRARLAGLADFEVGPLEKELHDFVEAEGIKMGDIIHALRVAVTGRGVGPGLYDCLAILGKSSVLARLDRAVKLAG